MTIKVTTNPYQDSVADYFDKERYPANLRLGAIDGFYHNHFSMADVDWSVLELPENDREEAVVAELHRLENAQADFLIDHLGPITKNDRLFDAGCGRGGTSFMANQRFGCEIDAVSISQYQVDFANRQAAERHIADRVRFHHKNMLDTGLPAGTYRASWNNESSEYVAPSQLFAEHHRLLAPGGRYVLFAWPRNDEFGLVSKAVMTLNAHYICSFHLRSVYLRAFEENGFNLVEVKDFTQEAIPYFELRAKSAVATGVEAPYIEALRSGSLQYMLFVADRI